MPAINFNYRDMLIEIEKGGGRTPPGTKTRESTSAWLL